MSSGLQRAIRKRRHNVCGRRKKKITKSNALENTQKLKSKKKNKKKIEIENLKCSNKIRQ